MKDLASLCFKTVGSREYSMGRGKMFLDSYLCAESLLRVSNNTFEKIRRYNLILKEAK